MDLSTHFIMVILGSSLPLVTGVSAELCWNEFPDKMLSGHNNFEVYFVSLEECKLRCQSHSEFVCLSLDYNNRRCFLSRESASTQPSMFRDAPYCTYWERVVPCDLEQGPEDGQACPPWWSHNSQNQHCYKVYADYKYPSAAKESCRAMGGYLLQIEDQNELDYVESIIRQLINTGWFWTGGMKVNGTWVWEVLDGEGRGEQLPMSPDFWLPGYPTADARMRVAKLLVPTAESGFNEGLVDNPGYPTHGYICEKTSDFHL